MKARLQQLRQQHWETRAPGERKLIALGAWVILPLLSYFLLWQPAHDAIAKLHTRVPQLRIQNEQMHQASVTIEALRHRPQLATLDAQAVKTAIEESATRHQLRASLTTLDLHEPNGVRITLTSVSFEKWLTWLRELQQTQHIRIESVAITPLAEPGLVAVRATLTNGNTL